MPTDHNALAIVPTLRWDRPIPVTPSAFWFVDQPLRAVNRLLSVNQLNDLMARIENLGYLIPKTCALYWSKNYQLANHNMRLISITLIMGLFCFTSLVGVSYLQMTLVPYICRLALLTLATDLAIGAKELYNARNASRAEIHKILIKKWVASPLQHVAFIALQLPLSPSFHRSLVPLSGPIAHASAACSFLTYLLWMLWVAVSFQTKNHFVLGNSIGLLLYRASVIMITTHLPKWTLFDRFPIFEHGSERRYEHEDQWKLRLEKNHTKLKKIYKIPLSPLEVINNKIVDKETLYALFGLSTTYTHEELYNAHRKLMIIVHPDRNPTQKDVATAVAQIVNAAYKEILEPHAVIDKE